MPMRSRSHPPPCTPASVGWAVKTFRAFSAARKSRSSGPVPPGMAGRERCRLSDRAGLAADPVVAVAPDPEVPADGMEPTLKSLRVHEVLDDAVSAAIAQASFDDLIFAGQIPLLFADVDVFVHEQHPGPISQQGPQQPPEPLEPASRHVREPRRKKDHVKARRRRPRKDIGNLEPDTFRAHPITG